MSSYSPFESGATDESESENESEVLISQLGLDERLSLEDLLRVFADAVEGMSAPSLFIEKLEETAYDKLGELGPRKTFLSRTKVYELITLGVFNEDVLAQLLFFRGVFGIDLEFLKVHEGLPSPVRGGDDLSQLLSEGVFDQEIFDGISVLRKKHPEFEIGELSRGVRRWIPVLLRHVAESIHMGLNTQLSLLMVSEQCSETGHELVRAHIPELASDLPMGITAAQAISVSCYVIKKIERRIQRFLDTA